MRKNQSKGSALTKVIGNEKPKKIGSSEEYCHDDTCRNSVSPDEIFYKESTRFLNKNPNKFNSVELHKHLKNELKEYGLTKEQLPSEKNLRAFTDAYSDFVIGAKAAGQTVGYGAGKKNDNLGYEDFQLQKQHSSNEGVGEQFKDISQTGESKGNNSEVKSLPEKGPHIKPVYPTGSRDFFENAKLAFEPEYQYYRIVKQNRNKTKDEVLKLLKGTIKAYGKNNSESKMSEEEINTKAKDFLDKAGKFVAEQDLNGRVDDDYHYTDFLENNMPGKKLPNRDWRKTEQLNQLGSLPLKKAVTLSSEMPKPEIVTTQNPTTNENIKNGQTLVKNMESVNNNQNNDYQPINSLPRKKTETITGGFTEIPQLETPISRALYNNITSDKNATFADTQAAADIARQASELQAKANRAIDAEQGVQNTASQNGTTIVKAGGGPITDADFAKYQSQPNEETTIQTTQTEQPVGNAMSGIANIVSDGDNQKPSYLGTTNTTDVGNIVVDKDNYYNNMRKQVDPLVVEQLGVQDYYPDINRNIGVGTFSGKRIGSQTIYAGGGVLLPMGLYDARLRALDKTAKEKQAAIDKLKEIPSVPDQFKEPFGQYYMKRQYEWLDKYNGNYDALKKDRNFQLDMQKMKDNAAELNYTNKYIDGIVDQVSSKDGSAKWVPEWMLKKSYQWKSAMMDDVDDIVSGKKNVLPLVNQIKSYENGTKWADDFAEQNFVEGKMGQTPLVFKQGSVKTPQDEKDYLDFVKAVKGRDYDRMLTGFKKFYDTSAIDSAVEAAFKTNNFDKDTMPAIRDYLLAQVPQDKIEMKQDIANTDNLGWANLAERKRQFDANMAYKQEQGQTHYEALNNVMNEEKNQNGRTYSQELASIRGTKGITEQQKRTRIKNAAESFGLVWSPTAKTYVRKELIPQSAQKDKAVTGDQLYVNVYEPIYKRVVTNGKATYVEDKTKKPQLKSIPLNEMVAKRPGEFKDANGVVIDADYQNEWKNAMKQGRLTFNATQTELSTGWSDNGNIKEVNSTNVQDYDPSKNRNIIRFVGTATTDVDAEGNALEMRKPLRGQVYVQNDISTQQGRDNADKIWGYTPAQLMKAGTINTGSSSYSSTPK